MKGIWNSYARVLLEIGVNLQKGQKLCVVAEPCHWAFLNILVREAYLMGASYVLVESQDVKTSVARVECSEKASLEYIPPWVSLKQRAMIDEGWASLSFFGSEDPDAFRDVERGRFGSMRQAQQAANQPLREACAKGQISWCRAALPTEAWAKKVFPELSAVKAQESLWKVLSKIMRLDASNPVVVWRNHSLRIKKLGRALGELELVALHFEGGGTNLSVGCIPHSLWVGGSVENDEGISFVPNLPTEEVFTSPDYRRTEGIVKVVKPVEVLGVTVEGVWFRFEKGKVEEYGAETGIEALEQYFELCPQSRYLGEVALVDLSTPIAMSGLTFHSILLDENASSHIALGSAYPLTVKGGEKLSKQELDQLGLNVSAVHTDFMIGSAEVQIYGELACGSRVLLLDKGRFVCFGEV